jgi:hypothetical protein
MPWKVALQNILFHGLKHKKWVVPGQIFLYVAIQHCKHLWLFIGKVIL